MKIKNLLQAPLILEELKRLNIDPTTLDPNTRVKIKDGCLVFEGEKECFVSKPENITNEIYSKSFHEPLESFDNWYRRKIQKNTLPEDGC